MVLDVVIVITDYSPNIFLALLLLLKVCREIKGNIKLATHLVSYINILNIKTSICNKILTSVNPKRTGGWVGMHPSLRGFPLYLTTVKNFCCGCPCKKQA